MKAIQYREDGKFYGFDNPTLPQYINSPNIRNYEDELRSNLAAGKEIINPEVLPIHKQWTGELQKLYLKYHGLLKPGHIFDCPDNIEFEEDQFCAYHNLNCSYCGTCAGSCYKPEKIIRLKLKDEDMHWGIHLKSKDIDHDIATIVNGNFMELASTGVKPVETQDELTLDGYLGLIGADCNHAAAMTIWRTLQEHKFTITRNKNGNE